MEKIHKAQVAKTLVLFVFLVMIPFISSSMRTSYLYFILNLLILMLAIESGLLTSMDSSDEKKQAAHSHHAPPIPNNPNTHTMATSTSNGHRIITKSSGGVGSNGKNTNGLSILDEKPKPTDGMATKIFRAAVVQKKMKKIPSRPSLFFIGGFGDEQDVAKSEQVAGVKDVEEEEEKEEFFDDDLFARAETFIGNFYKQLKIQREESWKKIHGLYHKPL